MGLGWGRIEAMDEEVISARLYAPPFEPGLADLVEPDRNEVSRGLRRKKHVTKPLLWWEYKDECGPRACSYSRFCGLYAGWKGTSSR